MEGFIEQLARQYDWTKARVRAGLEERYGTIENGMKLIKETQDYDEIVRRTSVALDVVVSYPQL